MNLRTAWLLAACALCGCARASIASSPVYLPQRELSTDVAGIGRCDRASDSLHLAPDRPLVLLVHGLYSREDGFDALARAFQAGGQQVACFRYDPRESLLTSAMRLRASTARIASALHDPRVLVFGHSQGGLVARAALAVSNQPLPRGDYHLVTVAAPFAGVRVAKTCGSVPFHIVSLGASLSICRAICGATWNQIHPGAELVRAPAGLDPAVRQHLQVITDERDSCRRFSADGLRCLQDDYVFSMAEQHNARIESDARVVQQALLAGHAEVIGGHGAPRKLIGALQEHGLLTREGPVRAEVFDELGARVVF